MEAALLQANAGGIKVSPSAIFQDWQVSRGDRITAYESEGPGFKSRSRCYFSSHFWGRDFKFTRSKTLNYKSMFFFHIDATLLGEC